MTQMIQEMLIKFFSQVPDETFDARLREIGVEEDNIKKLRQMLGKDK